MGLEILDSIPVYAESPVLILGVDKSHSLTTLACNVL